MKQELKEFNEVYPEEIIITNINDFPYILGNYNLGSKIFNKQFLQQNNITFPDHILAEDSVFLFKTLLLSEKTIFIKKLVYQYNLSRNNEENHSITFDSDIDRQLSRLKAYTLIYEFSKQKNFEEITIKYVLKWKLISFYKNFIIAKKYSETDLKKVFTKSKDMSRLIINQDDLYIEQQIKKLFIKISNKQYD